MDARVLDLGPLPHTLSQLIRLIGVPDTLRLLEARGGLRYRVPRHPERAEVLTRLISRESVRTLCEALGDQEIDLPKSDKLHAQIRDAAIRAERAAGASAAEVARRYRLTRRRVLQITAETETPREPMQVTLDLFEPRVRP